MSSKPTIRIPTKGRTVAVVGDVYRFLAIGEDTNGKYAMWDSRKSPRGEIIKVAPSVRTAGLPTTHPNPTKWIVPSNLQIDGTDRRVVFGEVDPWTINTSHVERNNLTIRTFMKRLSRLSLGFSKKLENLAAACALQFRLLQLLLASAGEGEEREIHSDACDDGRGDAGYVDNPRPVRRRRVNDGQGRRFAFPVFIWPIQAGALAPLRLP